MDKVEIRNLLLHPKLDQNVLAPLGYHEDTFKVICNIVEEAINYSNKKSSIELKNAVKELKSLNGDRYGKR